jgi:hypothetical protein
LLLFNPERDAPYTARAGWEKVRKYDTAWLCEEGRREEAAELAQEEAEEARDAAKNRGVAAAAQPSGDATGNGNLSALLRYRCEYEGRVGRR